MKILVPVKRVIDYNVKVRVKPDNSGVVTDNVKMSMNPFDEIAVEEAIRLKEAGKATEVTALSIGVKKCEDILRQAYAMGVDNAIHIETDVDVQPLQVAKLLQKITQDNGYDMVLLGKQAIDDDSNQTGQMLAALLGWPQATFASEVVAKDGALEVTREVDGGLSTVEVRLPAIVTTDLRLNEPRYVKLPDIMKARSKPIDHHTPESLGIDTAPSLEIVKVEEPPKRQAGIKVGSVDELLDKLRNEAKVI